MRVPVIVSAVRTAIARENSTLRDIPPEIYAGLVLKEAAKRAGVDPEKIEQVIMGCCLTSVACMARMASLQAGFPVSVSGLTVDRQCSSGLEAINIASALVIAGQGDIFLAGGVESMTRMPYLMEKPSTAYQREAPSFVPGKRYLAPPQIGDPPMGITAENVAEKYSITRERQDEFALTSQIKAEKAIKEGRFKEQILTLEIPQKKGDPIVFDTDEHPRFGLTIDKLAMLSPIFKKDGTVTAGNSSGINDGAAAVVVMDREKAKEMGLKILGTVTGMAAAGVDPNLMGMGPVPATQKALTMAGITVDDLDVIEINEAFASQAIACIDELGLDYNKVNPNGGAIALGHPIGASLAALTVKLLYELERQDARYGLVTACCGGGQGVATIIERGNY
jgi:acetyl-CoA acetyltransferase family protein